MFSRRRLAGARAARHQDVEPAPAPSRRNLRHLLRHDLLATRFSIRSGSMPKRRMESIVSRARGGMMTLTREPSGSRASTRGVDSSTAAHLGDDPFDDRHQVVVVLEGHLGLVQLPVLSM